jgi:hypothetical protein
MVALETYYIGPTDFRGSRIGVRRMDGPSELASKDKPYRMTVPYDDALPDEDVHFVAVQAFCAKYDWHGKLCCGGTDRGYVWVWVPKETPTAQDSYPKVWVV